MSDPANPNPMISITLAVTDWNVVLDVLSQQPYRMVANLILNIQGQAARAQPPQPAPQQGNGLLDRPFETPQ
jgi:hypothetical protein